MNWSPPYDNPPTQHTIKKFMICKVHFSPVGFLTLHQAGLLEPGGTDASRQGCFRNKGPMLDKLIGLNARGEELEYYRFADEYQEVI